MTRNERLNDTEQFVLLALVRRRDDAYGVTIQNEIEERAGRHVSIAAVYTALDRLERAGHTESRLSESLPERGGRARKMFRITRQGADTLRDARAAWSRMWEGVESELDEVCR